MLRVFSEKRIFSPVTNSKALAGLFFPQEGDIETGRLCELGTSSQGATVN